MGLFVRLLGVGLLKKVSFPPPYFGGSEEGRREGRGEMCLGILGFFLFLRKQVLTSG